MHTGPHTISLATAITLTVGVPVTSASALPFEYGGGVGSIICVDLPGPDDMRARPPKLDFYSSQSTLQPIALESPLGQVVRTQNGDNGGRVVDVLTDPSGKLRAAVIEYGGFLGIGSRKVAVAWNVVRFDPSNPSAGVTVELTQEQLRQAPVFRSDKPAVVDETFGRDFF